MTGSPGGGERIAWSVGVDGGVVAAADRVELLAWGGADVQPLWRVFGAQRYVGVAVGERSVWAVDDAGHVEVRRRLDGELISRHDVDVGVASCVAGRSGRVAVGGATGVVWFDEGVLVGAVPAVDVTHVCWSTDASRLLVAEADGTALVVDVSAATALGRVRVGGPPAAVVALPEGPWLVGVGQRLRPVTADGRGVGAALNVPGVVGGLALLADDALLAVLLDARRVELRSRADGVVLGTITLGREIQGVVSAARSVLVLGLAHGDVQRVDVMSGAVVAAPPHEGRARVPWSSDVAVDPARVRGLLARLRIGGGPVAVAQDVHAPAPMPWWQKALLWLGGTAGVLVLAAGVVLVARSC